MTRNFKQRAVVAGATLAIAASPLLAPAIPADAAASKLTCRASVSDSTPSDYSNVYVYVKTSGHANVRAVAHYKTTSTGHSKKADASGRASIKFYISGATPGRRVPVTVTVTKDHQSKTCSTSFKPHR